jgi:lipid II:glycine glycyltransferase (peptidoglycan interpeptide bridge formation enzyme)
MQLIQIKESQEWNQLITALPGAHILQSWQWGQVKSHFGWEPLPFVWHDNAGKLAAASLILRRTVTVA